MIQVSMTVNGKVRKRSVEPRLLLVHFLREELLLTGTHVGCDTSQCGACTVLVDGRSVKSCTVFAVQADGSDVTTIEGIAPDGGNWALQEEPIQRVFALNMGIYKLKYSMNFLMNLMHHAGVALTLGLGGWNPLLRRLVLRDARAKYAPAFASRRNAMAGGG